VFTGLIEALGEVKSASQTQGLYRLEVDFGSFGSEVCPGESVNIDGACLTAVQRRRNLVLFEIVEETARRTTLGGIKPGDKVNLERALKPSDRLGGHIVLGHIDGVGTILSKTTQSGQTLMTISAPPEISRYIIPKGSVAVDGVSLTVVDVGMDRFSVALIPYTLAHTTLGIKGANRKVNIEVDVLGKWIEKLLGRPDSPGRAQGNIDVERLKELGFA
jgi:riboflavin synthase